MYKDKIELTEKQLDWLKKNFKNTKNAEIAKRLGISETSMHRFARQYGLTKTKQFMRKVQQNAVEKAKVSHELNGTYPPKGYIIPRREECCFQKGVTQEQRLGHRRNRKRIEKAAESRRKTFKEERGRAVFGLPQKTMLRVKKQPQRKIQVRWYLKRRGYELDERKNIAYWSDDTKRSPRIEAMPLQKRFYSFMQSN